MAWSSQESTGTQEREGPQENSKSSSLRTGSGSAVLIMLVMAYCTVIRFFSVLLGANYIAHVGSQIGTVYYDRVLRYFCRYLIETCRILPTTQLCCLDSFKC